MNIKSDLILESASNLEKNQKGYVLTEGKTNFGFNKTTVKIVDKQGVKLLSQKLGTYITLDVGSEFAGNEALKKNIVLDLKEALLDLINLTKNIKLNKVLVVGLGNKQLISDSLGPRVVEKLTITRHVKEVIKEETKNINSVSAIATGVLGTTGIETADIVKVVANEVKPNVVILIDTLATANTEKIASSFQLTNAGITPGGGIGNAREPINKEFLGVPTIVIGVPLIVYAYSMCSKVLEKVLNNNSKEYDDKIKKIATSELGDLIVTVKDIDKVIKDCSDIISEAINMLVNPSLVTKT